MEIRENPPRLESEREDYKKDSYRSQHGTYSVEIAVIEENSVEMLAVSSSASSGEVGAIRNHKGTGAICRCLPTVNYSTIMIHGLLVLVRANRARSFLELDEAELAQRFAIF